MTEGNTLTFPSARTTGKCSMLFLGKSGAGKTVLFVKLFRQIFHNFYDVVFVFCPTINISPENKAKFANMKFKGCKSAVYFFDGYNEKKLKQIYKSIPNGSKLTTLIVLDDCLQEPDFVKARNDSTNVLNRLISSGRHKKVSICILGQNCKSISTEMRDGMDTYFLCNNSPRQMEEFAKKTGYSLKDFTNYFMDEMKHNKHGFVYLYDGEMYTSTKGLIDTRVTVKNLWGKIS